MAVKSIISVDIQDEAFSNLKRRFDQFDAAVKKLPAEWRKLGSEIVRTEDLFKSLVAMTASVTGTIRDLEKVEAQRSHHTEMAVRQWATLGRHARDFSRSVAGATGSILKWAGIGGLLGGLLGGITTGLGIERLAAGAAGSRRFAMGIGAGIGEARAFEVSGVERLLDPKSFLESVARIKSGVGERLPLAALGLGQQANQPTTDLAVSILRKVKDITGSHPQMGSSDIIRMFRLEGILGFMDIERIKRTSRGELGGIFSEATGGGKRYGLSDAQARKYEDFQKSLGQAGKEIQATFERGLIPLIGPLSKLVEQIPKAVEAFMKSDALKAGIEGLSSGLEYFAIYVGKPEFKAAVKDFAEGMVKLATGVVSFFNSRFFKFFFQGDTAPGASSSRASIMDRGWRHAEATQREVVKRMEAGRPAIARLSAISKYMTMEDLLTTINKKEAVRPDEVSSAGAVGLYGFMPGTLRDLGVTDIEGFKRDPELQRRTARRWANKLARDYHGDIEAILAAWNAGQGGARRFIDDPNRYPGLLPAETRNYIRGYHGTFLPPDRVIIENRSSTNVITQGNQTKD